MRRISILLTLALLLSGAFAVAPSPAGAFPANSGDIMISNHNGSNVQRLEPGSGHVTTLTSVSGTPIGLAFDPAGNLYINVTYSIQKLDRATDELTTLFTGSGYREGLAFDPVTNHLFSVSFTSNLIEEVDLSGTLVRSITIPGTGALIGINARGGTLVVSDFSTGQIFVGTSTGSTFDLVGALTPGATYAVDIDAAGNIYGNDFYLGKTVKFTPGPGGAYTPSDFITGLNYPANGLSIGDDGSFTISEYGANAISVWNSNGTLRQRYPNVQGADELVVVAPIRQGGCGEDGLNALHGTPASGVASGTVHEIVEPVAGAVSGDLKATVHDVNCHVVVPLENTLDDAL